jgi:hypothetical protein
MYESVIKRLEALGYEIDTVQDDWVINFIIEKVTQKVKNECNITEIPGELFHVVVDMVCGEFLSMKKSSGQLDKFPVDYAVKQIKEGDTSITYAVPDAGKGDGVAVTVDWLIDFLMNGGKSQLITFRRIRW